MLCLLALWCGVVMPMVAQSDKLIKELEGKRGALQKQIAEQESLLNTTRKKVGSRLEGLAALTGQMEQQKRYILSINNDLELIEREMKSGQKELARLQGQLDEYRQRYASSMRYLQRNRSAQDKLLFIFSARTLEQTYRRLLYVRQYADYQEKQGQDILRKQEQVNRKQDELKRIRTAKADLLKEREAESRRLANREKEQRRLIDGLRKQQRSLQRELARKRREADKLNARIDRLIAESIDRTAREEKTEARQERLRLSGTFTSNRGRLPMPVTGSALIVSHYGQYTVPGLKGVKLDNKGIDIQAQPGASARAVFHGTVAAIFRLDGLFNVLIRHGSYITVYCNLSTADVKSGQQVSAGQPLGRIFSDKADGGRTVLHFQLRKEKEKLDPEPWLSR